MEKIDLKIGRLIAASTKKENESGVCISELRMSKFLDGKLRPSEKKEVMTHLISCSDCYEAFSEVVVLLDECAVEDIRLTAAAPETSFHFSDYKSATIDFKNATFRFLNSIWQNPFGKGMLAPALVLAIVFASIYFRSDRMDSFTEMVDRIHGNTVSAELYKVFEESSEKTMTYGFFTGLSPERAAFRIGVLMSRLEVALRTGDRMHSELQLKPLISLIKSVTVESEVHSLYENLAQQLKSGSTPLSFVQYSEQIEKLLEKNGLVFFLKFGQWVQVGKMAASTRNSSFYSIEETEYYMHNIEKSTVPEGVVVSMQEIYDLINANLDKEADFKKLESLFEEIINILI
jgi:hypothetical protein